MIAMLQMLLLCLMKITGVFILTLLMASRYMNLRNPPVTLNAHMGFAPIDYVNNDLTPEVVKTSNPVTGAYQLPDISDCFPIENLMADMLGELKMIFPVLKVYLQVLGMIMTQPKRTNSQLGGYLKLKTLSNMLFKGVAIITFVPIKLGSTSAILVKTNL